MTDKCHKTKTCNLFLIMTLGLLFILSIGQTQKSTNKYYSRFDSNSFQTNASLYFPDSLIQMPFLIYSKKENRTKILNIPNSSLNRAISQFLIENKEPLLSSKNKENDKFRFIMYQPNNLVLSISLTKTYDSVNISIHSIEKLSNGSEKKINKYYLIPIAYWDTLQLIVTHIDFWNKLPNLNDYNELKSFLWIIECKTERNGYKFVSRWGIDTDVMFSHLCLYALDLAGFKELNGPEYKILISIPDSLANFLQRKYK